MTRFLRFRLSTLLIAVAFAAVLLGWLSDRRRLEEKIQQRDDLLSVLRAAAASDTDHYAAAGVASTLCNSPDQVLAWIRGDDKGQSGDDEVSFLGPSIDVVPLVLPLLKDPSAIVRTRAARALHCIGHLPPMAAPALIAAARDESPQVRLDAIRAIDWVVGKIEGLGTALADRLDSADPEEVKATIAAIVAHDPGVRVIRASG